MEALDQLQQIGIGPDSTVHLDNDEEFVIKKYRRLRDDALDWYIQIINSLTDYEYQVIHLTEITDDEGNEYKIKVRFSPHYRVDGHNDRLSSSYIPGPKLSDVSQDGNTIYDTENLGDLLFATFKGRSFQNKLEDIYQIILSFWIGKKLPASIRNRFDGVGTNNVKVVRYEDTIMLYVTDIFPNIKNMYKCFTNPTES